MAKNAAKDDVPVITVKVLIIAHVTMIAFIAALAWLDWSLPS